MNGPIRIFPFPFGNDNNPAISPVELGEVAWCDNDENDCFLISHLSSPITVGSINTYALFVKDNSEIKGEYDIQWKCSVNGEDIIPLIYADTSKELNLSLDQIGNLEIIAEIIENGKTLRTIKSNQWVKRTYPWFEYMEKTNMDKNRTHEYAHWFGHILSGWPNKQ